jgi:hypothetical protein
MACGVRVALEGHCSGGDDLIKSFDQEMEVFIFINPTPGCSPEIMTSNIIDCACSVPLTMWGMDDGSFDNRPLRNR